MTPSRQQRPLSYLPSVGPKEKSVGKREVKLWRKRLLAVTVWGALGDNEMTGRQVRLWRWLMLGWEVRLDG